MCINKANGVHFDFMLTWTRFINTIDSDIYDIQKTKTGS